MTGRIGAVRVSAAASATGKRDAFTTARALADTDIKLEGQIEADEPGALLALIGLDRIPAPERKSARLSFKAEGPPSRNFSFEGKLDAGPIDAGGKGVIRFPPDQPATLDLGQIAGTIGGEKVQGRLALRFEDTLRVDGSFETDTLDAPAVVAAAIGMRRSAGPGWSIDPLARGLPDMTGRIAFKAQRAVFAPALVARQLRGVARLGGSELVFEEIAGEMGDGHFEGRLAFERTDDGLSARVRVALSGAEAGVLFPRAEGPALGGKLSIQGEVGGLGRSPAALIGSLAGFGSVTLERGQLAGFNPGVFDAVAPCGRARHPERRRSHPGIRPRRARRRQGAGAARDGQRQRQCRTGALRRDRHSGGRRGRQGQWRDQSRRRQARCAADAHRTAGGSRQGAAVGADRARRAR